MQLINSRAYVRPARGLDAERMAEACQAVALRLGVPCTVYVEGEQSREMWLRALRKDEAAIVARLFLLAGPRKPGRRPSVDFTTTLADVLQRAAYIVDAQTGITSKDGKRWRELVEAAISRVVQGRALRPAKAREMQRKSRERAPIGVVRHWTSPAMREERERWAAHWRDPVYTSAVAAFEAMPAEMQAEFGSVITARRVFGPRHPGKALGRYAGRRVSKKR